MLDPSSPEVAEVATEAQAIAQLAATFTVANAEQYAAAGDELKRVKAAQKRLDEVRLGMTRPLDSAKRAVMDFFRRPTQLLDDAELGIKRAMVTWSDEQERIRREAQRKAEEAARKERERLEAQAAKAAAEGKVEKADTLAERAATVVPIVVPTEAPRVSGTSMREDWKFEVVDAAQVPREYLAVDEKKLGAVVRALKADAAIPGVRVFSVRSIASRSA
jgi:hypothetical protein